MIARQVTIPGDIPTAVSYAEALKLSELAFGGVVLELGAHFGFSTVVLAAMAERVVSIDWHGGDSSCGQDHDSSFETYKANLLRYGVADRVSWVVRRFEDVLPEMAAVQGDPTFDGCFIDGEHEEESVRRDLEMALPLIRPGGWVAFHDYGGPYAGVAAVADAWGVAGRVDNLAWGYR